MTDWIWLVFWCVVLIGGIGACVALHEHGLPTTYARDLLHIGAGIWVLGWPYWHGNFTPMLLCLVALFVTASVPLAARKSGLVRKVETSFAGGDEAWQGLVFYTIAYATLTAVGLYGSPFAAGAGLLALSLGDGIGGAVGRRFGHRRFRILGAKAKSLEGSLTVAIAAALGAMLAAWRFDVPLAAAKGLGLGAGAAFAEALSPRGADNLIVPGAVWLLAEAIT